MQNPLHQRRYRYNTAGQLAQIEDSLRGTRNYHYDPLDRLTQVEGPNPEHFIHDPAHNILAAAGSVEEAKQQAANTQIRGNRIAKTDSDQHTDFLWDGDLLLRETARDLNTQQQLKTRTYYFEPGTFKPIALDENGELYHYHLDHLGTPDTLTDSQGEIAWSVSYTAYGNLAIKHCNRIEQPIRFQGQYYDEETGLHYNRFRYYDPEVGAFTQQDPIGLLGGVNNYRYVPNPVGWVDPLGLTCKEETQHPNVSGNSSTVNSALHAKYVDELATLNKQLLFR
ncbi:RHS repeat domain-containing protein [Microbulbifer thermotolerans]|uniref:RHS repeat domain-containing protein n=2 Tax=Microbulbifer thermotolerans TaxID=252514 RepID=UPI000942E4CC|nr:RHS repeat-associated core domain-containing protein [Microbulbifer thermotolerans]